MGAKLTKAQLGVLRILNAAGDRYVTTHSVYGLGRNTCEALRKRGMVSVASGLPITKSTNPHVYLTDAGRLALKESNHA